MVLSQGRLSSGLVVVEVGKVVVGRQKDNDVATKPTLSGHLSECAEMDGI